MPTRRRFGRFVAVIASAFAAVTCDLVTGPTADSGITVEYSGPAVLTVGQTMDFDFTVLDGTVPIEGARVRVVSSDPDVIEVQGNEFTPRLFVKARGQATITATLLGSTLGSNPPFVAEPIVAVVNALAIDSASVTFRSLADTVRLHAEASDFNNQLISGAGTSARWSSTSATIVQVDSVSGRLTARGNGTAQVIARLDSTADTTTVLVQQRLVRFAFAPVNLVLNALNLDTVVTVTPLDSGGTPLAAGAPTFTTTMTALNAGIASVVRLTNTTFRVTSQDNSATATGVRVVDAINNVADDTLSVTVGQIAQSMVITTALSDTIDAFQDTLRVRARAFDARNVEVQGRAISWTSANTSVATVDQTGLVTGQTSATVDIQAKMDAATALASIHVRNTPRSVTLSLDSARITTVGDVITVGATARNRLGATVGGVAVTWLSLDATIAQVSSAGAVTAAGVGNTRVIATIAGGYADTLRVRVTNDPTSVDIVPTSITLASIGDTSVPNIAITNSRGASLGRGTVSWRSADTIVTVTATGIIVARAAGSTTVTATTPDSARADTVLVTVTNAPETVTLNRVLDTLTAPTRTLQYDAVVRNTRTAIVAGAAVNWRSSNASVASVNAAGLVTALAIGQTFVIGEATGAGGLRADTARLVVTNDVVSLTVSPTNITVPSVGATSTISADPRNAVGASVSGVTPIWTTSDANVATVDATGTVTGIAVGTATITGNVAGKTASAGVTVTNAPDTINIIPTAITLTSVNDSSTPSVHFVNALGTTLPRSAAQWTSNDGAIAQVTTDGIIVATGRGATLIRAVNALNPARRDSIAVTVTNAAASINVLRFNDVLPSVNRTISYAADVFNARGDLIPNELVNWVSRNTTVAVISSAGVATSVGIGTTRIVGTAGAVSDSAALTVSNSAASVAISPAAVTLNSLGDTIRLTATARNELGNIIPSPIVTWASSNALIATVNTSGLVSAAGTGSAQISATVDGVVTSITVTVQNAVTTIQITSGDTTLASVGDVWTPAVNFRNSLNNPLPRDAVIWTSTNSNVATVSSSGVVTAAGAGVADITASSPVNGSLFATRTVTVTNAPASLTLNRTGPDTLTSIGRTLQLSAIVRNAATNIISGANVTWTSSGSGTASVDGTGLVTAVAVGGPVRIIATSGTKADTVNIVVTNDAVSLALSPDTVTVLDLASTTTLSAVARNDLNNVVGGVTFSTLNAGIATVNASSGVVTTVAVGVVGIVATRTNVVLPTRADTTFVTVANAPRTINIVPASRNLASVGDTAFPQTTIQNLAGATLPRTAVNWASSATNVATVSNTGVVTTLAAGSTTITATSPYDPSIFDSYTVSVSNAPATVTLSASSATLTAIGRSTTFTSVVRNSRGDPLAGQTVNYTSNNTARATVDLTSGLVTAVDTTPTAPATPVTITATVAGFPAVTATAAVTVTNNPASIATAPTSISLTSAAQTSTIVPTVRNDLGAVISGWPVTFTSDATGVATVGASSGVVSAVATGSATITASAGSGVTAAVPVSVTNYPATIVTTLVNQAMNLGGATFTPTSGSGQQIQIQNGLGAFLGLTSVAWTSSNTSYASVSAGGVVTAVGAGSANITATSPGNAAVNASYTVIVSAPAASITLDRTVDSLSAVGRTLLYTATVRDANGNILAGQGATAWSTSNAGQASVATTGAAISNTVTAVAVSGGTRVTITASVTSALGTFNATALVGVGNDPASISLPTGVALTSVLDSTKLTAVVRNNLGNPIPNAAVTWQSSNTSVVRFQPSGTGTSVVGPVAQTDTMRIRAEAVGSATVTATATGGPSTTTAVTVTNDLSTLDITPPAGTTVSLLDTLFPAVTFQNGLGASLGRTAATWSSSNSLVATVSTSGVITGIAVGTARVYAVSPSNSALKDSIDVTITNVPASVTLSLTGPDTMLAAGQQLTYAATVRNARNDVISGAAVTWGSTSTGVATVDAAGVVTAAGQGSTNITATSGTITSAASVLQVELDPANIYVSKDSTVTPKLGTRRRPFSRIQDGLNLAGPGDNVWVQRSATAYAESLVVGSSVTLRGQDTTAAVCTASGCTTPANLPTLAHNFGSAAIRTASGTVFTLRHLAITHNVDGPALDANGTDVTAEFVYVNPSAGAAQGRGLLIRNAPIAATVRKSQVRQVRGYGIRLENSSNSTIDSVSIANVAAVASITDSAGIHITGGSGNRVAFSTVSGGTGTDGIRLTATTNARLRRDSINGGRYGLYAESSTWLDTAVAVRSATGGFLLGASNTVTSDSARIGQTTDAGVILTGASNTVTLRTIRADTVATTTDSAAIDARSGAGGSRVTVTGSRLRTAGRRAVRMGAGAALVMRNDTIIGPASGGSVDSSLAVVTTATLSDSVSVARSVIRDFPGRFALNVAATNIVRVDSNDLARNRAGVNFGNVPATYRLLRNDLYDHAGAVGLTNAPAADAANLLNNWWGDARGPRRFVLTAGDQEDTLAVGDSVGLTAAFTSAELETGVQTAPNSAINGSAGAAASIRLVRGDLQTLAASGSPSNAPLRLTVRVVDANGRPVNGVTVNFSYVACGGANPDDDLGFAPTNPGGGACSNVNGATNTDGIAEAILEVDNGGHTVQVTATATGLNTVTFSVTRNP